MSRRATSAPPQIDGFEFLELLGSGGFADVFMFQQERPRRKVAVKVLLRGLGPTAQQSFEAEANLMAHLSSHPAIVSIFQVGVARDGRPFIVMENYKRQHLGARVKQRPLSVADALDVGIQVASAVETAHRAGIIHRDIKPANILLSAYDRPALTDFGISVSTTSGEEQAAGVSVPWAPPEQIQPSSAAPLGPATDVYSLAATIYTLLVGRSPFEPASSLAELTQRVLTRPVPSTGRADVPESLERVLATAMSKQPGQRYPSALELARALQQVQTQLHLSLTQIVLDDVVDDEVVEEVGEATVIGNIKSVDPDGDLGSRTVGATQTSMSGVPRQESRFPTSTAAGDTLTRGSVPATSARGAYDFTGPASYLRADDTIRPVGPPADIVPPAPAQTPEPTPEPPSRPLGKIAAAVVGVAVVGVAGVAAVSMLQGKGATAEANPKPSDSAAAPADPVGETPPSPGELRGTVQGDDVVFVWKNPEPKSGDYYLYRLMQVDKSGEMQQTDKTTASVPKSIGQTCLEVTLVRGSGTDNGQSSEPATKCEQTP